MTDPELMAHMERLGAQEQEETKAKANPVTLREIVKAGEELEALEKTVADLEMQLKATNKKVQEIKITRLPRLMMDVGLNSFELRDGTTIEIADIVNGKITDETREIAHDWLRKNNHGDLIKNEVTAIFGKGEDLFAEKLMQTIAQLREAGDLRCGSVEQKERVHPQTLGAFLREMLASNAPFPSEMFNLEILKMAKLKRAEAKRV